MRLGPVLAVIAALWVVGPLHPAAAQVETDLGREFANIVRLVEADRELVGLYGVCPAEAHASQRGFFDFMASDASVAPEICEANAAGCVSRCLDSGSAPSCFGLARAFQRIEDDEERAGRLSQILFARSCALGHAAGCTNRGAGVRNGDYRDDPFAEQPSLERDRCQFATFELTCDESDAWGCAMLGQSLQLGEGVAADRDEARRAFERSCDIAPDFAACDFAKARLAGMAREH